MVGIRAYWWPKFEHDVIISYIIYIYIYIYIINCVPKFNTLGLQTKENISPPAHLRLQSS